MKDPSLSANTEKPSEKESTSEKDKEQPMDVDKKPCDDTTASTQSITESRTPEEPERIVKVS